MTAENLKKLKHELRTPINHIIGYSELLMENAAEDGSETVANLAESLRGTGKGLAMMIDKHLLAPPDEIGPAEMAEMHDDVVPVLDRLLANRSLNEQATPVSEYCEDLAKIYAATEQLKAAMLYEVTLLQCGH